MKPYFYSFSILFTLMMYGAHVKAEPSVKITMDWEVGHSSSKTQMPGQWMEAEVPGAVQLDYARANDWEPYWYSNNFEDYAWMEDEYWTYRTNFTRPEPEHDQRLIFISKGIDYEFDIYLNGEHLLYQEGMFTPVKLDITGQLKENNELLIVVYPAPKVHKNSRDRSQANRSVKPAVSYGWDWHPRLIPLGIWDETYLEIKPVNSFDHLEVDYSLSDDLKTALVKIDMKGKGLAGLSYDIRVKDRSENEISRETGQMQDDHQQVKFSLEEIRLWWPWDQGEPYLYDLSLTLKEGDEIIDSKQRKLGFRKVELVMNEGTWQIPDFPKSRSEPPITMKINGREIFCRGTNWVNPEIFPGIITRERYDELTDLALQANFNMLRIWGGGIVNKASFFELCDEKGIMVWQDFPLACNPYEGTPGFLKVLEQEATSIINRLKEYPSLVMWCGGNELFNSWSGMTDQSLALRLLNSLTYRLDPDRPFIYTSPIMGIGHGHYVFRDWSGREVYQWMPEAENTAYTEFGMPGPSSLEVLESFIPEDQLFPPQPGTVWETHHAYGAWVGNTWLMEDMIEHYFGPSESLETLVSRGQLLQGEGYKVIYEEARRQKPHCSMALNWCFNEPWPTAANNSLINWPAKPKPAFDAVRESCRPALASARIPGFTWRADDEFSVDLYILNDSPAEIPGGKMIVKLFGDKELDILNWDFPRIKANKNLEGPTARIRLPDWQSELITLVLEVEGQPGLRSEYTLLYYPREKRTSVGAGTLNE